MKTKRLDRQGIQLEAFGILPQPCLSVISAKKREKESTNRRLWLWMTPLPWLFCAIA